MIDDRPCVIILTRQDAECFAASLTVFLTLMEKDLSPADRALVQEVRCQLMARDNGGRA